MQATLWDPSARELFAEWEGDGPAVARAAGGFVFTEGPVWVPHLPGGPGLLFSDIPADTIYRWRPREGQAQVWRRPSGHSNGQTLDREGRLLTCEHHRRRLTRTALDVVRQEYGEEPVVLAARYGGRRLNSPNDVVVRRDGAVYFTDPTYGLRDDYGPDGHLHEEQERRRIFMIPAAQAAQLPSVPDGRFAAPPEPVAAGHGPEQPNGLVFSPDERVLYVGDSAGGRLFTFGVLADGTLDEGRVVHAFDRSAGRGNPDGMRSDAEGRLWCTGPGGLWVLSPDARPLAHVRFPEVTANVAFGEADGRTLFVTATASLYRLRVTVPGRA